MLQTYPAVLRDGQLEWGAGGPPALPPAVGVPVHVTLLTLPPPSGSAALQALEALAATGGPSGFGDPVEWQRAVRDDRPVPGRGE